MKQRRSILVTSGVIAGLVLGLTLPAPTPAKANDFAIGAAVGFIAGQAMKGMRGGKPAKQPKAASKSSGGSNAAAGAGAGAAAGGTAAAADSAEVDMTLTRYDLQTDQSAVFKSISLKSALTSVGAEKSTLGIARGNDYQRNYYAALERFMDAFETESTGGKSAGGKSLVVVQVGEAGVTRNTIERLVANAYKESGLETFERFAEENWTAARLKVAILDRASNEVYGMTTGPSAGAARYADVEDAINRAAKAVYQNVFELSEMLAVNQAIERFNQTATEHGYFETTALGSGSEKWVTDSAELVLVPGGPEGGESQPASDMALTDIRRAIGQNGTVDLGNALRYRIERIAIDCFVEQMIADDTGVLSKDAPRTDLAQRTRDLARSECREWVRKVVNGNQFRKPMPQRVVWQADGTALESTTMFTQGLNAN